MHLLQACALALVVECVSAFLDTSPLLMFSTTEFDIPSTSIQSASQLNDNLVTEFQRCPSTFYIFVGQPGISTSDLQSKKSTPNLARRLSGQEPGIKSTAVVRDVAGDVRYHEFRNILEQQCGTKTIDIDASLNQIPTEYGPGPHELFISFPALHHLPDVRQQQLSESDAFLASVLDMLPSQNYTVMYLKQPKQCTRTKPVQETGDYEMVEDSQAALHTDLKRDFGPRAESSNQTMIDGPLFDKYQYLSPGLFMGLFASFILLSILYVGVSALSSLSVTYAAFDKEQGQSASKKLS